MRDRRWDEEGGEGRGVGGRSGKPFMFPPPGPRAEIEGGSDTVRRKEVAVAAAGAAVGLESLLLVTFSKAWEQLTFRKVWVWNVSLLRKHALLTD